MLLFLPAVFPFIKSREGDLSTVGRDGTSGCNLLYRDPRGGLLSRDVTVDVW
jgi:hypothetical protein